MPKPEVIRCKHCGQRLKRSAPQNARYWLLVHKISDKVEVPVLDANGGFVYRDGQKVRQFYSPDTWHEFFKSRLLGMTEWRLPNGKTLLVPKSTADLDTPSFADFMTNVEVWANEHDVYLDEAYEP